MGNRWGMAIAGVLGLALLAAPGCVSKKNFHASVEDTDSRIAAVESAIEDTDRRVADLKKDTDTRVSSAENQANQAVQIGNQAMTKATAAENAAMGKLLWTITITDDKVKFPFGKAELTSEAIAVLDRLVNQVKAYGKALYLEVEGHTDNVGNDSYNEELASERAMAVRNYLNQKGGIPLHAMNTIGFGENRPVADNSSTEGRAHNRRVVIRVLE